MPSAEDFVERRERDGRYEPLVPGDIHEGTVVARAPDVGYVELDEQGVCYDPCTNEMHLFNPVAQLIWRCLDGRDSVSDITTDIAEVFTADESTVRNSVFAAVFDFAEKGLVVEPRGSRVAAQDAPPTSTSPRLLTDPPNR